MSDAQQRFGRYKLIRPLEQDAIAEIHLAHQVGPHGVKKPCVLKLLSSSLLEDQAARRMLVDEARTATLLSHPGIVQAFDYGEIDGRPYLAMELVDGINLAALLRGLARRQRWIPLRAAVEIAADVAAALAYASTLVGADQKPVDLVHAELSPRNVLLLKSGGVKLAGFGNACRDPKHVRRELRSSNNTGYFAPEQALYTERPLDVRADLFALGVIVAEMLSAQRVSPQSSGASSILGVPERVKAVCALRPEAPAALVRLVTELTSLDPDARPRTAKEVEARLRAIGDDLPSADRLSTFLARVFPPRPKPPESDAGDRTIPSLQIPNADTIPEAPSPRPSKTASGSEDPTVPPADDARTTRAPAVSTSSFDTSAGGPDAPTLLNSLAIPSAATEKVAVVTVPKTAPASPEEEAVRRLAAVARPAATPAAADAAEQTTSPNLVPSTTAQINAAVLEAAEVSEVDELPPAPMGLAGAGDWAQLENAEASQSAASLDDWPALPPEPPVAPGPSSRSKRDPYPLAASSSPPKTDNRLLLALGGGVTLIAAVAVALFVGSRSRPDDASPPEIDNVAAAAARMSEYRQAPDKAGVTGTLRVTSTPPGAEILVDGLSSGVITPGELSGLPIDHPIRVEVAFSGFASDPRVRNVRIPSKSRQLALDFVLREARTVRLVSDPPGAEVELDGVLHPIRTPADLPPLPLGSTTSITLSLATYLPAHLSLEIDADTASVARVRLTPAHSVDVTTEPPGAKVFLDGRLIGQSPLLGIAVPSERAFELRAALTGFRTVKKTFNGEKLATRSIELTLKELPLLELPLSGYERSVAKRLLAQASRARSAADAAEAKIARLDRQLKSVQESHPLFVQESERYRREVDRLRAEAEQHRSEQHQAEEELDALREVVSLKLRE